jgi:hypothetical protein
LKLLDICGVSYERSLLGTFPHEGAGFVIVLRLSCLRITLEAPPSFSHPSIAAA